MGLLIFIFKSDGDCTNGGASSRGIKGFCLLSDEAPTCMAKPCEDYPAARLITRTINGKEYKHIEPVRQYCHGRLVEREGSAMFGGNLAYSSDSRFPNTYPLTIHDRIEQ